MLNKFSSYVTKLFSYSSKIHLVKWTEEKRLKGVVPKPKLSSIQQIFLPWVPSLPEWKVVKQNALEWCMVNQWALTHFQVGVLV
jgi:hypothetical protein